MNLYIKKYSFAILRTILLSLIAYLALVLVYCIPTEGTMEKNMRESVSILEDEGDYPILMNFNNSKLDNYADSIMLLIASHTDNNSPFISSLTNTRSNIKDLSPSETLVSLYKDNCIKSSIYESNYQRYWHGYLLLLKPLLYFFDYGTIRSIIASIQTLLFVLVVYNLRDERFLVMPFAIVYLFWNPVSISLSLEYSCVSIITLIGSIIIIKYRDRLSFNDIEKVFLLMGALTSYFDLLTYPIVSLGIPLILYISLKYHDKYDNKFKDIIFISIMWSIGYAVMWSMKWVIASLLTNENTILDAINTIMIRTSNDCEGLLINYLDVLFVDLGSSLQFGWLALVVVSVFVLITLVVKKQNIFKKYLLQLFFIGLYPFIWAYVLKNHSYWHCFFVYRIFSISVFAFAVYVSLLKKDYVDKMLKEDSGYGKNRY